MEKARKDYAVLTIVGCPFRKPAELRQLTSHLHNGLVNTALFKLVPEPTNKYDANAVRCVYGLDHVGYVRAIDTGDVKPNSIVHDFFGVTMKESYNKEKLSTFKLMIQTPTE